MIAESPSFSCGEYVKNIVTGYIFPNFDLNNAENYAAVIYDINRNRKQPLYIMPILETEIIADITTRNESLVKIKKVLDIVKDYVLNVRVGVNDLSNLYGLRRDINHTVYDIVIVRDILTNILNVFAKDYVVAGSVWNYFDVPMLNLADVAYSLDNVKFAPIESTLENIKQKTQQ